MPDQACKPSSVSSAARARRMAIICLGRQLPGVSGDQPEGLEASSPWLGLRRATLCSILLPMGFAWPGQLPGPPVVSCTTVSLLPCSQWPQGDLLSVALCRRVTPPGRYPASRSMELGLSSCQPNASARDCPACSGTGSIISPLCMEAKSNRERHVPKSPYRTEIHRNRQKRTKMQ